MSEDFAIEKRQTFQMVKPQSLTGRRRRKLTTARFFGESGMYGYGGPSDMDEYYRSNGLVTEPLNVLAFRLPPDIALNRADAFLQELQASFGHIAARLLIIRSRSDFRDWVVMRDPDAAAFETAAVWAKMRWA